MVFRDIPVLWLNSFGRTIAHFGCFRAEFVARRRWLEERVYANLVALCQFSPGPAGSKVGIGIGLSWAGLPGPLFTCGAYQGAAMGPTERPGRRRAVSPVWTSSIKAPGLRARAGRIRTPDLLDDTAMARGGGKRRCGVGLEKPTTR